MLLWLKRWVAYLLLSSGLILLFVPLCAHRMENIDKDCFFLENSENLLTAEKSARPFPPKLDSLKNTRKQKAIEDDRAEKILNPYGYPRAQSEDLAPYPALADAVKTMRRIWPHTPRLNLQDAVPPEEWNAFKEAAGISAEDNAFQYGRYIFRGYIKKESVFRPG